ncbi:MAG: choice-of-anchor Q domain-containing protein [Chloroflexota bacterium]
MNLKIRSYLLYKGGHLARLTLALALLFSLGALTPARHALGAPEASIIVNTFLDEYNTSSSTCSLREAITAANTNAAFSGCSAGSSSSQDSVVLAAGAYYLTRTGANEDNNVTGDLDVKGNMLIMGDMFGSGPISVNANLVDRVFHIHSGATVGLTNLIIEDGRPPQGANGSSYGQDGANGADGGGIYNEGNLTLTFSTVRDNVAGNGGNGREGLNGANGGPGLDGATGAAGGSGGDGGNGGGIYNAGTLTINSSNIEDNYAGRGGNGSYGGNGGVGGNGTTSVSLADGGDGGRGGSGGSGGKGGSGGGLYMASASTTTLYKAVFDGNNAGVGGNGNLGGLGGTGGHGIDQWGSPIPNQQAGRGGDGGDGGIGGSSGIDGSGGNLYQSQDSTLSLDQTTLSNGNDNPSGTKQAGGGGSGGRGGNGGDGTYFNAACDGKSGGNGGTGGRGGYGLGGGSGGGLFSYGTSTIDSSTFTYNQTIRGGHGGLGGNGGDGGDRGEGYPDPVCYDGEYGLNGDGGVGGNGGPSGHGGGLYAATYAPGLLSEPQAILAAYLAVEDSTFDHNSINYPGNGGRGGDSGLNLYAPGGDGGDGGNGGNTGIGGGVFLSLLDANFDDSTLSGNQNDRPGGSPGLGGGYTAGGSPGSPGSYGDGGLGGGLYASASTVDLYNLTVANNQANSNAQSGANGGRGGGIYVHSGTVTIYKIIMGDNSALDGGPFCYGSLTAIGTSLIENTSGCSISGGSLITGQDPWLTPLGYNGGPTRTHLPWFGSPALDAGGTSCVTSSGVTNNADQRGAYRPVDSDGNGTVRCDLGSVEMNPDHYDFIPLVVKP